MHYISAIALPSQFAVSRQRAVARLALCDWGGG
jgi:hypothetical protein